jgi:hypothetical protein
MIGAIIVIIIIIIGVIVASITPTTTTPPPTPTTPTPTTPTPVPVPTTPTPVPTWDPSLYVGYAGPFTITNVGNNLHLGDNFGLEQKKWNFLEVTPNSNKYLLFTTDEKNYIKTDGTLTDSINVFDIPDYLWTVDRTDIWKGAKITASNTGHVLSNIGGEYWMFKL